MSEHTEQVLPAKVRQPRRISPFWLLPIIAFIIGALLFFQILNEQGERITIRFNEGDGISAGKTLIRYQGLQIGQVKKVYFVEQMKQVEVEAEINPEAKSVLKEGTKFWLVKPSASLAGVSGLDALVSGNYITVQPNEDEEADSRYSFIAEEEPPAISVTDGDLLVHLVSADLGSMTVGAEVFFRKVPVGRIADYRFTSDQKQVEIDVVIEKKYAQLVKQESRFWNISGVSVDAGLTTGVKLHMDSLATVVKGAVAFDSPEHSLSAEQGQKFALYENLASAQRGVEVQIVLPVMPNVKVNETAVYYQNLQIGVLSHLHMPDDVGHDVPKGMRKGTLRIDPNYQHVLRSRTQILLKEPHFSLNKTQISQFGELFRGAYFEIEAGEGEPSLTFTVQKEADYLLSRPNVLALTLTAPQSYGVDQGQGIYYQDVQIGEILTRQLALDQVRFQAVIYSPYRELIHAQSQFVAISHLDVAVGLDGMRIHAGSPSDWLKGGVRVMTTEKRGMPKAQYPLYKDVESAENGITDHRKFATVTLHAEMLAGLAQGALVLYRDFPVGEVLSIVPKNNGFDVSLFIHPSHRKLLSDKNRFWVEPAAQVSLSPQGINIQAAPLMRTLKGAISFDQGGHKNSKTLYSSYEKATSGNTYLTLTAKDASKLSQGMPIKYMGLTVGRLEKLQLDSSKKQVNASAYIEGQYYAMIAKSGSRFFAVSPEIDTTGVKNLDAALQNYIRVEPALSGAQSQSHFALQDTQTNQSQYGNGFPIVLETTDANGITPNAPVFYRGMQVGIVQSLTLSELGDRVLMQVNIEQKYKHLVRKNSQFWASSGYTMDISLAGASINSGTMSQLLNGGISFSTPSGSVVQPQAEPHRHFRLARKTPEEALSWDMGIAP